MAINSLLSLILLFAVSPVLELAFGYSTRFRLMELMSLAHPLMQELMVTIALCEALLADRGAVRVHGGGFGGTAQAFVPLEQLDSFKEKTEAVLGQGRCHKVMIRPAGGVRLG